MDSSADNYYNASLYTKEQYYILLIAASIASTLSMLGSLGIVICSYRRLSFSIYQKLVFMISIFDGFFALCFFLQQFLLPKYTRSYGLYVASGNAMTCSFIGFCYYVGMLLGSFYNFYLSLYFYGKVKYNILDGQIQKRYQTPANVIAIVTTLGITISGLIWEKYQPRPYVNVCTFGTCQVGVPGECATGTNNDMLLSGMMMIVMTLPISSAIATVCVYRAARKTLMANDKYRFNDVGPRSSTGNPTSSAPFHENTTDNLPSSLTANHHHQPAGMPLQPAETEENDTIIEETDTNISNDHISNTNNENDRGSNNNNNNKSTMFTIMRAASTRFIRQPQHDQGESPQQQQSSTTTIDIQQYQQQKKQQHNHLNASRLRQVRNQTVMYSLAYLNSFCWSLILFMLYGNAMKSNDGIAPGYMALTTLCYIFIPCQGFFNFLVYTRPRYLEYRKLYPHETRWQCFILSLTLESANSNKNYHRRSGTSSAEDRRSTASTHHNTRSGRNHQHQQRRRSNKETQLQESMATPSTEMETTPVDCEQHHHPAVSSSSSTHSSPLQTKIYNDIDDIIKANSDDGCSNHHHDDDDGSTKSLDNHSNSCE